MTALNTRLQMLEEQTALNAKAYRNSTSVTDIGSTRTTNTPNTRSTNVVSAAGFPSNIQVTYRGLSPYSVKTKPLAPSGGNSDAVLGRAVESVVLQSFGRNWSVAALNAGATPVRLTSEADPIYVASGSTVNYSHATRVATSLYGLGNVQDRICAHFVITRDGDLVVIGGCDDILASARDLSDTCVSIALEEAFYTEFRPTPQRVAIWGNVKINNINYFPYSFPQLLTLATLIRKLELVYPGLTTRKTGVSANTITKSSGIQYCTYEQLRDVECPMPSKEFMGTTLWDLVFKVVNKQTHITKHDVFVLPIAKQKLYTRKTNALDVPLSVEDKEDELVLRGSIAEITAKALTTKLEAQSRISALAETTRKMWNSQAAASADVKVQMEAIQRVNAENLAQVPEVKITVNPVQKLEADGSQPGSEKYL